jgi:acetyltransferase
MVQFHRTLSDRTVYLRYFASLSLSARIAHERLLRICFGDYEREMVLVVEHRDPKTGKPKIVSVGRLNKLRRKNEAEIAVLISDQLQGRGIGYELLQRLIQIARDEKLIRLRSEMMYDNVAMQVISKRAGFQLHKEYDSGSVSAVMEL